VDLALRGLELAAFDKYGAVRHIGGFDHAGGLDIASS
jgi:hypothetical protein